MTDTAQDIDADDLGRIRWGGKRSEMAAERFAHCFDLRPAQAAHGNEDRIHAARAVQSFQSWVCFSRENRAARNSFKPSIEENT